MSACADGAVACLPGLLLTAAAARYVQVADVILLFSVCASYGVAAGLYYSARNGDKVKTA